MSFVQMKVKYKQNLTKEKELKNLDPMKMCESFTTSIDFIMLLLGLNIHKIEWEVVNITDSILGWIFTEF